MQTFLTKVSQKKIKMIHLLLETDRWCSIEELQNELKVSSKSILNYLTDLEELFQQYPDKVILKNENNRRFSMEKQENFPIYTIYLHFYRKSYNYHLIEFMYQHPEKTLENYADAQYTSVSTVFRYAKLLVKYFEMTDVKEQSPPDRRKLAVEKAALHQVIRPAKRKQCLMFLI
ncbi:M protein trans-acting positive regulator [Enterococcus faecium EnGen0263]|nr:M protein trans-acting positive regulator [Enterococcus faecium EnGen0263]